jgi:hypothetical protein
VTIIRYDQIETSAQQESSGVTNVGVTTVRALDIHLRVPFVGWVFGSRVFSQGFVHKAFTRLDIVIVDKFADVEMGQMFVDKVSIGLGVIVGLGTSGQANCGVGFRVGWWWVGGRSKSRDIRFLMGWRVVGWNWGWFGGWVVSLDRLHRCTARGLRTREVGGSMWARRVGRSVWVGRCRFGSTSELGQNIFLGS